MDLGNRTSSRGSVWNYVKTSLLSLDRDKLKFVARRKTRSFQKRDFEMGSCINLRICEFIDFMRSKQHIHRLFRYLQWTQRCMNKIWVKSYFTNWTFIEISFVLILDSKYLFAQKKIICLNESWLMLTEVLLRTYLICMNWCQFLNILFM